VRELFPKRTSNNLDTNTLLQMLREFLNLVGYGIIIYELFKFFKKHGILMVKIVFYCMNLPFLAYIFLSLKREPKETREFFNFDRIFRIALIEELHRHWSLPLSDWCFLEPP